MEVVSGLIGYTGFVGDNILKGLKDSSKLFNSKNIQEITEQKFDVLYITAIQAKKWWANQNTEEDKALIDELFEHLSTVKANKVVFIGTDNDISEFLANIASCYGIEYHAEDRRENVLTNKFGLDINNPDTKDALLPLIKYDLELYKKVTS
ncbi:MAG: hypothetical protein GY739_11240 [Mesoflavibacter sp.]|nr:hypothetical protein [Mesoflavibacter sp.]